MSDHTLGLAVEDLSVAHLDGDVVAAVEARCLDADRLTGCQPADRQRLETSLPEPAVLAIDADVVLGRQVAERRKRGDVVRVREQPGRDPGVE